MEEEIKEVETPIAKETVETIIQNGVSKEQLQEMLSEILGSQNKVNTREEIERAETEYFTSHLKY